MLQVPKVPNGDHGVQSILFVPGDSMNRYLLVCAALAAALGCTTSVQPSNPYDPNTPPGQQAAGKVVGKVDTALVGGGGETLKLYGTLGAELSTTADASGAFAFSNVTPDVYYAELKVAGFLPLLRPNIRVPAGQTVDLGVLSPSAATTLDGALTGHLDFEGGGPAVGAVARVELQPDANTRVFVLDAPVDATGRLDISLKPGTYAVTGVHPLYLSKSVTGLTVTAGASIDAGTVVLPLNPATLSGLVLFERVPDAANTASTAPGAGATVTLDDGSSSVADAGGRFALSHLAGGPHSFRVQSAGYHDPLASHPVTLIPGQATALADPVVLALDRGDLTGTVLTGDGRAIDATVSLAGTTYDVTVVPDALGSASGSYRFRGLPDGQYQPVARARGYFPAAAGLVTVAVGSVAQAQPLTLAPVQGDFSVASASGTAAAGYTPTPSVLLQLSFTGAASVRFSEDSTFSGGTLAYQSFLSTLPFTLQPQNGTHVVYAQYKDAAGTASGTFSASIVLDGAKPTSPGIAIEGGAPFTNHTPSLALTLSAIKLPAAGVDAVSPVARVRLSRDGVVDGSGNLTNFSSFAYLRDYLYLLPSGDTSDGQKNFWVQFQDGAGNLSNVASASVIVDTLPPSVTRFTIDDGARATQPGYTDRAEVTLRLAATEQLGDSILIRLANSAAGLSTAPLQPYSAAVGWSLDTPGTDSAKTVYARFSDLAGNVAPDLSAQTYLDATPPAVAVSAPGLPGGLTNSATVALSVSASDAASGLAANSVAISESATFTGATFAPFAPSPSFTLSAVDGPHTVFVRARDKAGNTADASLALVLDTSAPTASLLVGDGSGYSASATVSLTLQAASADIASAAVVQDPGAPVSCAALTSYTTYTPPLSTVFAAGGSHAIAVCLKDFAGNVSPAPLTGQVVVDTSTPVGGITLTGALRAGTPSTTVTANPVVTLGLSATSGAAPVDSMQLSPSSSFAGLTWQPLVPSALWQLGNTNGSLTVYARFRNKAGTVSVPVSASITLDTQPPTGSLAISSAVSGYVNTQGITLAVTAVDNLGLAALPVELSEDPSFASATKVALAASMPFTLSSAQGNHTVYARFTDTAGNTAVVSASAVLDTAPANALSLTVGNGSGYSASRTVSLQILGAPSDTAKAAVVQDPASAVSCSSGSLSYVAWAPPLATVYPSDGPHTVSVCLMNAAGNVSTAPLTGAVTIDTTTLSGSIVAVTGQLQSGAASTTITATPIVTLTLSATTGAAPVDQMELSQTSTFVGNWQIFQASTLWQIATTDGPHLVYVRFHNKAGNISATASAGITLDTHPPSGTVAVQSGSLVNSTAIQLAVAASDAIGLAANPVELSEDPAFAGASYAPLLATMPFTLGAAQGLHTVYARFVDGAGNTSLASAQVTLDTIPPTAGLVVGNGSGYSSAAVVGLTLSAPSSDLAATAVIVDPSSAPGCSGPTYLNWPSTLQTPSLANGTHTVYVCLKDRAGNLGGPLAGTVLVDGGKPTGGIVINGRKADGSSSTLVSAGPLVTLSLTATAAVSGDPVDAFAIANDNTTNLGNAVFQPFQSSLAWQLSDGDAAVKTVYVYFRSHAGVVSDPVSQTITLDTHPPSPVSVAVTSAVNGYVTAQTVTLSVSAADAIGLAASPAQVSEDPSFAGAPLETLANANATPFVLSSAQGTHTVYARFVDNAGNAATASTSVVLDTILPTAGLVVGSGSGYSSAATVSLTLTAASPDLAATSVIVDPTGAPNCAAATYTNWPSTLQTPSLGNGAHTVYVCLKDKAGNLASPAPSGSVLVDTGTVTGSVAINGRKADGTSSTSVTSTPLVTLSLTASSAVATDAVVSMAIANDASSNLTSAIFQPFQSNLAWQLSSGDAVSKFVYVQFRNAAGTTSAAFSQVITLDTQPPAPVSVAVTSAVNGYVTAQTVTLSVSAADAIGLAASPAQVSEDPSFAGAPLETLANANATPFVLSSAQGTHTVYARFVDNAGNAATASTSVVLDTILPTAGLVLGNGSGLAASSVVSLSLSAPSPDLASTSVVIDPTGTVNCASSLSYAAWPSTLQTPTLADGSHTVSVCLKDKAGNVSTPPPSGSILVDTGKPGGSLSIIGTRADGSTSTSVSAGVLVTLGLTASSTQSTDPVVSMAIANDSLSNLGAARFQPFQPGLAWQLSSGDGTGKTVYVKYQNQAGTVSDPISQIITLDTHPPTPVSIAAPGQYVNALSRTVALAVSETDNIGFPANSVELSEDPAFSGVSYLLFAASMNFTLGNVQGLHTIYARFIDTAGNTTLTSTQVTLDTIAPSATVTVGDGSGFASGSPTTVQLPVNLANASSDIAFAAVLQDVSPADCAPATVTSLGGSYAAFAPPLSVTLTEGKHTVIVCLKDFASNVSTPLAAPALVVDLHPPTVSSFTLAGTLADGTSSALRTSTTAVTLTLAALSALTDQTLDPVTQLQITNSNSFASAPWVQYQTSITGWQLPTGDGSKMVQVRVRTAAGQISAPVSASITLDGTPPVWSIVPKASATDVQGSSRQVTMSFAVTDNLDAVTALQVSFLAVAAAQPAPTNCAGFTAGYGSQSPSAGLAPFTLPNPGVDTTYAIYSCVEDLTHNPTLAPGPYPTVRVDYEAPQVPVLNQPVPQGSGVLLSWTDPNATAPLDSDHVYDVDHFTVQYSTDPAFGVGPTTTLSTPSANPPALQFTVTGLSQFQTWYFHVQAVERSGAISGYSAAVSAIPGLGALAFPNLVGKTVSLFADGPDLWAHYLTSSTVTCGSATCPGYSEVLMHCAAGEVNCHNSGRWTTVNVPYSLAQLIKSGSGGSTPAGAPNGSFFGFGPNSVVAAATMFADDNLLWLANTGQDLNADWDLLAYSCPRSSNCDLATNWSGMVLRTSYSTDAVPVFFSSPAGAVTGHQYAIAFGEAQWVGNSSQAAQPTFAVATCPRNAVNACTSPASTVGGTWWSFVENASQSGNTNLWCGYPSTNCPTSLLQFEWRTPACACGVTPSMDPTTGLQLDVGTSISASTPDLSRRLTMNGDEFGFRVGARAGANRNVNLTSPDNQIWGSTTTGNPIVISCLGTNGLCSTSTTCCSNTATSCSTVYGCGEVVFSNLSDNPNPASATADIDALPPVFASTGGEVLGAFVNRLANSGSPKDVVKTRACVGGCSRALHLKNFTASEQIFPAPTQTGLVGPFASERPQLAVAVTGHSAATGTRFRVSYADVGQHKLWLASCDATSSCSSLLDGTWANDVKYTLVASGTGADATLSAASSGQNFFVSGLSAQNTTNILLPLVPTPFFTATPTPSGVLANWSVQQDSLGSNVLYGGTQGPPWQNDTVVSDPFSVSVSVPSSSNASYFAMSSFSSEGTSEQTQPWQTKAFGAPVDLTLGTYGLYSKMPFSIDHVGSAANGGTPASYNGFTWAAGVSSAGPQDLAVGRCPDASDCSQAGNWQWVLAETSLFWLTAQIQIDYQRRYTDAGPLPINGAQGYPRIMVAGRTTAGTFITGCNLALAAGGGAPRCLNGGDWGPLTQIDNSAGCGSTCPGVSTAVPTLRMTGDYLEVTEAIPPGGSRGSIIVRTCDGSPAVKNVCTDTSSYGAIERDPMYCLNTANWKSYNWTIPSAIYGVGNGATAGFPHPTWGFMAVQGTSNLMHVMTCPYQSLSGCNYLPVDCSAAVNWTHQFVAGQNAHAFDLTASLPPYYSPTAEPAGYLGAEGSTESVNQTAGVYLSYNVPSVGWQVANCRGTFDYSYVLPWACTSFAGWGTALVAPRLYGDAVASTIRVVEPHGHLTAMLLENGLAALATCPDGMDCSRGSNWHVGTVATGIVNDQWVAGTALIPSVFSYGMLASDPNSDLWVAYPSDPSGPVMRFLSGGIFSGP